MARKYKWDWVAPIFLVLAIFGIYLALSYLPTSIFGSEWATIKNEVWLYLPWLVVFGVGVYILKTIIER